MKVIIRMISKGHLPIRTSTTDKTILITYTVYLREKHTCTMVSKLLKVHGKISMNSPLEVKCLTFPCNLFKTNCQKYSFFYVILITLLFNVRPHNLSSYLLICPKVINHTIKLSTA